MSVGIVKNVRQRRVSEWTRSVLRSVPRTRAKGAGISKKDVLPSGRTFLMNYLTQSSQTLLEVLSLFLSIVISTLIGKQDVVR